MYPCGLLGCLLTNGLDVKLWELVALLLPFCGVKLAADNIVELHKFYFLKLSLRLEVIEPMALGSYRPSALEVKRTIVLQAEYCPFYSL